MLGLPHPLFHAERVPTATVTLPGLSAHRSFGSLVTGVTLYCGPWLHRVRTAQAEEIRRNPNGKFVPLEDRLAAVQRPRARWAGSLLVLVTFSVATVWAIYMAATTKDSAFVGFAIYMFIPVAVFSWRTRALRHRRPGPPSSG